MLSAPTRIFGPVSGSCSVPSTISRPTPAAATFCLEFHQRPPLSCIKCNSPFAESPPWETGVRNVYVSFRENITQWGRKKFMAGWLHLYAVGLAGLDRIVCGRIAYGIDPDK